MWKLVSFEWAGVEGGGRVGVNFGQLRSTGEWI